MDYFRNIIQKLGIDGALFFTLIYRGLQATGALFTIVFIAAFLNKEEQGYYYTFGSILAIQIFFELGITAIITQFVAHETASVSFHNYKMKGNPLASSRLSSLLRFCINWFIIVCLLLFVTLIIVGFIFFNTFNTSSNINWQFPWVILCFSTAVNLFYIPLLAFIEGLGYIKIASKIKATQQFVLILTSILFLLLGLGLYASPIALLVSCAIPPLYILFSKIKLLLKQIWNDLSIYKVNYFKEIFPLQWKVAISWASGYFIYQLFNPIVFAKDGAEVAGRVGMSLAVINGILTISLSWMNIRIPQLSKLIAQRNFTELDIVFRKNFKNANFFSFLGLFISVVFIIILNYFSFSLGKRFLSVIPFCIMAFCAFINQFIGGLAIYLRCHKKEPLLIYSFVIAICTATFFMIVGSSNGLMGIVWSYFFITTFISLPWVIYIYITKKKQWHTQLY
ncbi:polysaccharide biosynthesis protein [Chryseobacterium sp. G0240]|uniref:polysaccharide biosynthesis protein n=1 Tax=Chryseobacterium sp. G0240 TaxID=2487066 RepID=UPI000F45C4A7|nr:polysaccharide biosynthesis protein [Chryseobacterium sp. G0240]ROI02656.1 polysaccharide biosynthesis protein [Chryseobacterium sp. G0240]